MQTKKGPYSPLCCKHHISISYDFNHSIFYPIRRPQPTIRYSLVPSLYNYRQKNVFMLGCNTLFYLNIDTMKILVCLYAFFYVFKKSGILFSHCHDYILRHMHLDCCIVDLPVLKIFRPVFIDDPTQVIHY